MRCMSHSSGSRGYSPAVYRPFHLSRSDIAITSHYLCNTEELICQMQVLGTDPGFVREHYSDAERPRLRIEVHKRYSAGETERLLDHAVDALRLSSGLRAAERRIRRRPGMTCRGGNLAHRWLGL